ncbi:MAG TPA: response regulator transcription factor [Microthrixaceae bacterium]|jgi:DNA-binding response OmpR family regulator|nr:response regulator transcription factor [Actinomycetota bacterium]HMR94355.1 response regulator transcription factor [Microthrixaceae bacterium]HMT23068.1 response regulator transcription factor [Microthrixaceae bacterium]HMT59914.1 response regulator transcription factor [Microthrixaceae bacterium]
MEPPRILVVEDEDTLRRAMADSLTDEGYVVGAFADGRDLDAMVAFSADLAVLDVMVPGRDGFQIAAALRARRDVPVLFVTARDALDDRLTGFGVGADDYVVKPVALVELAARARAILRRTGHLHIDTLTVGDLTVHGEEPRVVRRGAEIDVTATEWRLLLHLARNRGRTLSKTQLLTHVWGYDAFDPNLVEVHISALRRKLEAHGPRVISTVRGVGYRLDAVDPDPGAGDNGAGDPS